MLCFRKGTPTGHIQMALKDGREGGTPKGHTWMALKRWPGRRKIW